MHIRQLALITSVAVLMLSASSSQAASIGSSLADAMRSARASDQIGVIVELSERANVAAAAASVAPRNRNARSAAVIGALQATSSRSQAGLRTYLRAQASTGSASDLQPFWLFNGISVKARPAVIRAIASRPEVASVVLDEIVTLPPTTPGSDEPTVAAAEWGIDRVGAPLVWQLLGTRGEGSMVGILDSGVDADHPDLLNGPDAWFDAVFGIAVPYDVDDHGSHVTGTSVGGDASGSAIGVAPGARYMSCKAFHGGTASATDILQCMEFFTDPDGVPGTADYPDVVNNSWQSGTSCNTTFTNAIAAWWQLGIFPAIAAGNSGPGVGSGTSPGQNPGSFGIGATDINENIASFSGRGPSSCDGSIFPEVSAPGVNIRSAVNGGGYANFNGTSMATPHVAGCIALIRSAADLDNLFGIPQAIWDWFLITRFAKDLGSLGPDNSFGAGRLNCAAAVFGAVWLDNLTQESTERPGR